MGALTPIDQVIRQLCRETGEPDYKNYDTILSHVRGAIIDLNLFVIPSVKTVELKQDQLNNLQWPCDCIQPLMVGLKYKGKICNVSFAGSISAPNSCGCNNMSDVESDIYNSIAGYSGGVDEFYYDGQSLSGFGLGYDKLKACVHDKETRTTNIKFRVRPGVTFQFTYSSDGISGGVTHVPVEAETAIGEWVFWKYYKRTSPSLSDRGRFNYKEEFMKLRKLYQDQSIEEWINAIVRK